MKIKKYKIITKDKDNRTNTSIVYGTGYQIIDGSLTISKARSDGKLQDLGNHIVFAKYYWLQIESEDV